MLAAIAALRYAAAMRILLAALIAAAAGASACGGSSKSSTPTTAPAKTTLASATVARSPGAAATVAGTPAPATTPSGEVVEVAGIVARVNASTRVIGIKLLSGAQVTEIDVQSSTAIRRAGGDSISLASIKTSDRIIARGRLNDRHDALVATELTVQDVVSGSGPGG